MGVEGVGLPSGGRGEGRGLGSGPTDEGERKEREVREERREKREKRRYESGSWNGISCGSHGSHVSDSNPITWPSYE